MVEEKRTLADVLVIIEDEGFEYTFVSYSKFPKIADTEFHRLRRAYLKARAKLAVHIGYEACDAEWHDDPDAPNATQAAIAAHHRPRKPQSEEPLTDGEVEALARFLHDADPPTSLSFEELVKGDRIAMERAVRDTLAEGSNYTVMLRAALDMIRRLAAYPTPPPDTITLSRADGQAPGVPIPQEGGVTVATNDAGGERPYTDAEIDALEAEQGQTEGEASR